MTAAIARRPLGRSELAVSELGLGCGPLGGLWRAVGEDHAVAIVSAAYETGVRYFDVAPLYGHGLSEKRLGRALAPLPRGSLVVSTKVGRLLVPTDRTDFDTHGFVGVPPLEVRFDYSRDGALRSIEESLQRLALERIDIALIHDIDRWTHGHRQPEVMRTALDGAYPALRALKDAGVIRSIGLGVNESQVCLDFAMRAEIDCLLLAGRYTLLDQSAAETLLPFCAERGIGVIIGGPFNSGILATGAGTEARYDYAPAPPDIQDRVRRIESLCREHGVPLPAAALQFPLRATAVAAVIPGAAGAEEARHNAELIARPIPDALWAALHDAGLIVPAAN